MTENYKLYAVFDKAGRHFGVCTAITHGQCIRDNLRQVSAAYRVPEDDIVFYHIGDYDVYITFPDEGAVFSCSLTPQPVLSIVPHDSYKFPENPALQTSPSVVK